MIYCNDLRRCRIFRTESVASCVNRNCVELRSFQRRNNIQVKRLTESSRLFCSVKNGNLLNRIRNRIDQRLCAERSVKTNFYNADFFSCRCQVIDRFFNRITYGTHCNDHMFRIFCSVVIEQFVVRSELFVYFVHIVLNDSRKGVIIRVARFSCLEEDVRILSGTSKARMIRIQCMSTELIDRIHVHHIFQIFIIPCLNLLNLMRCTESVKEVNKRKFPFKRCAMSNRCQVHNFLYA